MKAIGRFTQHSVPVCSQRLKVQLYKATMIAKTNDIVAPAEGEQPHTAEYEFTSPQYTRIALYTVATEKGGRVLKVVLLEASGGTLCGNALSLQNILFY